jgi:type I restriction enzyme M protein
VSTEQSGVTNTPDVPAGMLIDYVSGVPVRDTPEEREAVQIMAERLVQDYGYAKDCISTRPQHRVRHAPSDNKKSYPVDIAVFNSSRKADDELYLLVECKRRNRRDGLDQLKLYMDMSAASFGVWFNGDDHEYIRKVLHEDGSRTWETLPNIPRFGESVEDIGLHRRQDLKPPSNLRAVFKDIRNHLAGNLTGITRDEALAQEIINLLFCKIYDELNSGKRDLLRFRFGHREEPRDAEKRVMELFEQVKLEYPDVFAPEDVIKLDPASIAYVVGELQGYAVTEADRDAVGDAFEVFIGPALRGAEGQFFTPRNVVKAVVQMVDPQPGETIIDPACGSGGFLTVALEHVWQHMEGQAEDKGWSPVVLDRKKRDIATRSFRGIDKDSFLARVTKAYMALLGDGRGGVFCENSLQPPAEWSVQAQDKIGLGKFDVVVTNPPFGKKIRITGPRLLQQYDMGHRWRRAPDGGRELTNVLHSDQPPQLLFVERCLQLLKPGGRLGIVLPESILGNPSYAHVLTWLRQRTEIVAVAAMPEALFKTGGNSGTHTKVCILVLRKRPRIVMKPDDEAPIFMADAKWCGHDSRGNRTARTLPDGRVEELDDIPTISENYDRFINDQLTEPNHLGFGIKPESLRRNILIPKYYDPELWGAVKRLEATHEILRLSDLVEAGAVSLTTGIEVGKMAYGTGPVPFIRTSDISNWELKADPKHGVSVVLYEELRSQTDVREGDILMVRDGTYLIGTCAVVSKLDERMLFQSHIIKIRVLKPDVIDPWLLFAALNSPIVKRQIRAMRFTQDIIDTLGGRLVEIAIPLPRDAATCKRISRETREAVVMRAELRERTRRLALEVEGLDQAVADLEELSEAD